MQPDPTNDLRFQRDVSLSPAQIWEGWTNPDRLMQWFCPRPWRVVECDIDLRPGGVFRTVMQSPEGERQPASVGTYLLVEPTSRLVWTNALGPGFRPQQAPAHPSIGFYFVVDLTLEPLADGGTRYTATVMHQDEPGKRAHEAMGFYEGWGAALDQLVELG